ncbi:MAG: proteasome subunit alpha [Nitrospinae bacterium CG11_big_fil_rev_8_21_14_0_20_56_8]|nr:MAG: proteasome subunit alpha [Nitrospinae bacterium CG11_big_fil_rev_8_21_14_0_20_56_8]
MFEEPFRWMEAISTRHSYVREKLSKGQPVLGVPFDEGALLMSFTPQPGKVFEIYDRIAIGGLGHPADVERLRMTLLEMAHVEGFNRSAQDVTLSRLLQFGIAPALKQNFEEVQRAPYLIQLILAEISPDNRIQFFRLNYDGYWEMFKKGTVAAGNDAVREWIQKEIEKTPFETYSLEQALETACRIWEQGKKEGRSKEEKETESESPSRPESLKEAFETWTLEAAVLSRTATRKALFRHLTAEEIDRARAALVK